MCGKETLSLITSPSTNYGENALFSLSGSFGLFSFCSIIWSREHR